MPYVDPAAAERLFRHEVFTFLLREELISTQRVELLSSWRHSGFSVHNSVYLLPGDHKAVEALVRYMARPPVSLARLRLLPGKEQVLHFPKTGGGDDPGTDEPEQIDAMECVARVLAQIPPPRKHLVRYHGYYSNAARGKRRRDQDSRVGRNGAQLEQEALPSPAAAAMRKRWADLLRRVYEVDPLVCPRCSASMKVIAFITQPATIRRILDHLRRSPHSRAKPPPARHPDQIARLS